MKLKVLLLLATASILLPVLTGCGGGGGSAYDSFKGGSGGTDWTVMVFLNADNDLERFSIDNVNQMEKIGSTDRVKIVVQWDRGPGYSTADGDWQETRRYRITKDGNNSAISSELVQNMGELDMGDPQVMKDFIAWAQKNFPAKKYCLVVWNHGSGWRASSRTTVTTRNVSFDDTSGTSINTLDLPDILSSAPEPIDLVAMDASLMQMIEVAYEMKGTAGLLTASEESPPGEGYVYDRWLGPLVSNPSMDAFALAKTIADQYIQAYSGSFPVTQSVVDLGKISLVGQALDNFATALIPFASTRASDLQYARENAQYYSYDDYKYKDLIDYAGRVTQAIGGPELTSAYSSLSAAMKSAVLYETHTGTAVAGSHGLSIWIPDPITYNLYSSRYSVLSLSQDTRWDQFLAAQMQ